MHKKRNVEKMKPVFGGRLSSRVVALSRTIVSSFFAGFRVWWLVWAGRRAGRGTGRAGRGLAFAKRSQGTRSSRQRRQRSTKIALYVNNGGSVAACLQAAGSSISCWCGFECVFEDTRSGNLPIFAHLCNGICGHRWNVQANKNFARKRILSCVSLNPFRRAWTISPSSGMSLRPSMVRRKLAFVHPNSWLIALFMCCHRLPNGIHLLQIRFCRPMPTAKKRLESHPQQLIGAKWRVVQNLAHNDHMSGWEGACPLSKNRYVLPASSPTHWLHDEPVHKTGHLFVSRSVARPRAPSSTVEARGCTDYYFVVLCNILQYGCSTFRRRQHIASHLTFVTTSHQTSLIRA